MNIWRLGSIAALLLLTGCRHTHDSSSKSVLQVGAAEVEITPPVGFRMAGYFSERLGTGMHDPLKAKAVVLRDGKEEIAMVFCDLIGMSLNVSTNARAQASRLTGIRVSSIMICATHTHTGPLFDDADDVWRDYFHKPAVQKYGNDPHETIDYSASWLRKLWMSLRKLTPAFGPRDLRPG